MKWLWVVYRKLKVFVWVYWYVKLSVVEYVFEDKC